jgi:hypothetical protein
MTGITPFHLDYMFSFEMSSVMKLATFIVLVASELKIAFRIGEA